MKTKFYSMIPSAVIAALLVPASVATARSAFSISVDLGSAAWGVSSYSSHRYVATQVSVPVYAPQPVYYAPQPVYCAPQPVYYAPQPVYYAPQPVYYAPQPVVYASSPSYGYYVPRQVVHYAPSPRSVYYAPSRSAHHRTPSAQYCPPPPPPYHGSAHGRRR